jgi:hypothetical protein
MGCTFLVAVERTLSLALPYNHEFSRNKSNKINHHAMWLEFQVYALKPCL